MTSRGTFSTALLDHTGGGTTVPAMSSDGKDRNHQPLTPTPDLLTPVKGSGGEGGGRRSRRRLIASAVAAVLAVTAIGLSTPLLRPSSAFEPELAQKQLDLCKDAARGGSLNEKCLERTIADQLKAIDPAELVRSYATLSVTEGSWVRMYCHPTAHAIGSAVYDHFDDARAAVKVGADFCDWGYYHGVMKRLGDFAPTPEVAVERSLLLCDILQEGASEGIRDDYVIGACYHSIGHMLASRLDGDLVEGERLCALGRDGIQQCAAGLIMDWFDMVNQVRSPEEYPVNTDRTDPRLTCLKLRDIQHICASYMSHILKGDKPLVEVIADAGAICTRFESLLSRYECAYGLGMTLNDMSSLKLDVDTLYRLCAPSGISDEETVLCLVTYIEGRISTSSNVPLGQEELDPLCTEVEERLARAGITGTGICGQAESCFENISRDPGRSWCGLARGGYRRLVEPPVAFEPSSPGTPTNSEQGATRRSEPPIKP